MTEPSINNALEDLRREIEQLDIAEPEAKERLASLLENIEQNLDYTGESDEHQDMVEDVKDAIAHFEIEHPHVTGILGEFMMALSNMGI